MQDSIVIAKIAQNSRVTCNHQQQEQRGDAQYLQHRPFW